MHRTASRQNAASSELVSNMPLLNIAIACRNRKSERSRCRHIEQMASKNIPGTERQGDAGLETGCWTEARGRRPTVAVSVLASHGSYPYIAKTVFHGNRLSPTTAWQSSPSQDVSRRECNKRLKIIVGMNLAADSAAALHVMAMWAIMASSWERTVAESTEPPASKSIWSVAKPSTCKNEAEWNWRVLEARFAMFIPVVSCQCKCREMRCCFASTTASNLLLSGKEYSLAHTGDKRQGTQRSARTWSIRIASACASVDREAAKPSSKPCAMAWITCAAAVNGAAFPGPRNPARCFRTGTHAACAVEPSCIKHDKSSHP